MTATHGWGPGLTVSAALCGTPQHLFCRPLWSNQKAFTAVDDANTHPSLHESVQDSEVIKIK